MAKSFKDMMKRSAGNIMIIDGMNLSFRWKHAGVFDFKEQFYSTAISLATSYNCGTILVTADRYSSRYRKNIYPDYKANRQELREKQSEKEAEEFKKFLAGYEEAMDYLAEQTAINGVFRIDNVEADDLAAFIVKEHKDSAEHIWLISSDKDWDLLLAPNVSRWSYASRREYTLDNWEDRYPGLKHEDYITVKCLMGDSGDNVPGVVQVGEKRAIALVNQFGNVFEIAEKLPIDSKYKYIKNLNNFGAEQLMTNLELMDLLSFCEDAIGKENIENLREQVNESINT